MRNISQNVAATTKTNHVALTGSLELPKNVQVKTGGLTVNIPQVSISAVRKTSKAEIKDHPNPLVPLTQPVQQALADPLPLIVGIRSISTDNPIEPAPKTKIHTNVPVLVGDSVIVTFSSPVDAHLPKIMMGSGLVEARDLGQGANNTERIVEVPESLDLSKSKWFPITATIDKQAVTVRGQPGVTAYPPPNGVVEDISPKLLHAGADVKVTGSGFFGPKDKITLSIGGIETKTSHVDPSGAWFTATVPDSGKAKEQRNWRNFFLGSGATDLKPSKPLKVAVWGAAAALPDGLTDKVTVERVVDPVDTLIFATLALIVFLVLYQILYRIYIGGGYWWLGFKNLPAQVGVMDSHNRTAERPSFIKALLLDPQTNSYSLSQFQFFWWLAIILYTYTFLAIGRGFINEKWGFPPLSGFAYTFLISLSTLVAAQATTVAKGSKGTGEVNPAPSDLIFNGGVVAPERAQQLLWTILIGIGFVWMTFKTFSTTGVLPTIPDELLGLMGISSAGYIAGKMSRKAGPNILQVLGGPAEPDPKNPSAAAGINLKIIGNNFSRDAFVWIGDYQGDTPQPAFQQPKDKVTASDPDPTAPNEFFKALTVIRPVFDADGKASASLTDWETKCHTIMVVNADGQRSVWQGKLQPTSSANTQGAASGRDASVGSGNENSANAPAPSVKESAALLGSVEPGKAAPGQPAFSPEEAVQVKRT